MRSAAIIMLCTALAGCATSFEPKSIESVPFRDRAVTQVDDDVTVTAAVPDAAEPRVPQFPWSDRKIGANCMALSG